MVEMRKDVLFLFMICLPWLQSCSAEFFNTDSLEVEEKKVMTSDMLFIDQDEAEFISNQFFRWRDTTRTRSSENKIIKTLTVKSEDVACGALMYVVNYADGFSLISATKALYPILAYSDKGSFNIHDTTNVGLSIWLKYIKDVIVVEMNNQDDLLIKQENYNRLKTFFKATGTIDLSTRAPVYLDEIRNHERIEPLITTEWHQRDPYNKYIPFKYLAGCVPVAIAQVVNYHKVLDGENIDFLAIENGDEDEIAKLIAQIGSGVDMVYTSDASYPDYCLNPFNLFCYRQRIERYLNSRGYIASYTDNFGKKPTSLPVIYDAYKEGFLGITHLGKGHHWVVDGYESYDIYRGWFETAERSSVDAGRVWGMLYLHFNWGWGDHPANGWYGVSESYQGYSHSAKSLEMRKK